MRRLVRVLGVVGLAGAACALGLPAASAAGTGMLRLAHLSPDTPAVDVYVDSVSDPSADLTLPAVGYGAVSDYREVPPGTYTISMRSAGAAQDSPPVLSTTVQVAAGTARTVAGVGHFSDLGLRVLDDDLTPPPPGRARMRVVAAAATAPTLDVTLPGGRSLASGLAFAGTSGYVDVPAGSTTLTVTPSGSAAVPLPVAVSAGSVYSVLVLDRSGGGLTVRPVLDAAGPGVVPRGGVPAGEGGTARRGSGALAVGATGIAVAAGAGLLLTARPRRRRPGRRTADG
jgi:Domain of unknown function (DUF4397)